MATRKLEDVQTQPAVRGFRYLVLAAAVMTYLLIVMGGIVRVTGSGLGCPDWPTCYGRLIPPLEIHSIIEYLHRLIASLTTPFILAAAAGAWLYHRPTRWIARPLLWAVGLLVVQIVLGGITVILETPPEIVAVHLGVALMILGLVLAAAVVAFARHRNPALPDDLNYSRAFARASLVLVAATFIVLVSGAFVAGSGSTAACLGWPLCNGQLFPTTLHAWIHMTHRFLVGLNSILVVWMVIRAWRTEGSAVRWAMSATTFFYFAQALIGALKTTMGFPIYLLAMHVATAAAVWASLIVLAVVVGLAERVPQSRRPAERAVARPANPHRAGAH